MAPYFFYPFNSSNDCMLPPENINMNISIADGEISHTDCFDIPSLA